MLESSFWVSTVVQKTDTPSNSSTEKSLNRKDLLGIRNLSPDELTLILDASSNMKAIVDGNNDQRTLPYSLATLFYEPSTRTRVSFERAARALGMSVTHLSVQSSSVVKGESLKDTALTLEALGYDVIIVRHGSSGVPHFISKCIPSAIINAGDGINEHPTQALLDLFTIREHKGKLEGLNVAILGDVKHSRVARSTITGLIKLGNKVSLCGPPTMIPLHISNPNVTIARTWEEAISDSDVIYLLRIQQERQKTGLIPSIGEYARVYGMDTERISLAKSDAIIMHPGPINRGVEISPELADGQQTVILPQVTNGIAVRMAILDLLLKNSSKKAS